MRNRGTGRIYKPQGCSIYWIQYYRDGKRFRQSAETTSYREAEKKLDLKVAQIRTGTFVTPHVERIKVSDLAQPFFDDLKKRGKGTTHPKRRWNLHLEPYFGWRRVASVGTDALTQYVNLRSDEGAANATVNREIAALRSMFRLGYSSEPPKVMRLPQFPHLKEDNVRKGFIEPGQFDKMAAAATQLWLRSMLEIYYTYGWRLSEVMSMQVRQADFDAGVIRLDVGTTKNKEGREVHMTSAVRTLLTECARCKQPNDCLFTRKEKDGTQHPVLNFRKAWRNLCAAAGVPGLLVHDMRRSAARDLRRAGVDESVIMKIGGWKTPSVFKRYNIVDQRDIREGLEKREEASRSNFGH